MIDPKKARAVIEKYPNFEELLRTDSLTPEMISDFEQVGITMGHLKGLRLRALMSPRERAVSDLADDLYGLALSLRESRKRPQWQEDSNKHRLQQFHNGTAHVSMSEFDITFGEIKEKLLSDPRRYPKASQLSYGAPDDLPQ